MSFVLFPAPPAVAALGLYNDNNSDFGPYTLVTAGAGGTTLLGNPNPYEDGTGAVHLPSWLSMTINNSGTVNIGLAGDYCIELTAQIQGGADNDEIIFTPSGSFGTNVWPIIKGIVPLATVSDPSNYQNVVMTFGFSCPVAYGPPPYQFGPMNASSVSGTASCSLITYKIWKMD